MAPALAYVLVWTTLLSYREVTMALFLQSPRNVVLSTAIWSLWLGGDGNVAAALGTIMVITMGVIIIILLRTFPKVFLGRRAE